MWKGGPHLEAVEAGGEARQNAGLAGGGGPGPLVGHHQEAEEVRGRGREPAPHLGGGSRVRVRVKDLAPHLGREGGEG